MYGGIPRNYPMPSNYPIKGKVYGPSIFEQIPLRRFYEGCEALYGWRKDRNTPIIEFLKNKGIIKNEKTDK